MKPPKEEVECQFLWHEEARQHAGFAHVDECTTVYKRLQSFY